LAVLQDEQAEFYKENKKVILTLRNKQDIEVDELGTDYYGRYGGQKLRCPIYDYKALDWFIDQVKFAIKNDWDQVIVIAGRERAGKSDLEQHILNKLNPEYSANKITFTQEEFKNAVFDSQWYDTVVMDEGGEAMMAQE